MHRKSTTALAVLAVVIPALGLVPAASANTHPKVSGHHVNSSRSSPSSTPSRTTAPRQTFNRSFTSPGKIKNLLPGQTGGCGCGPAPCQCKIPGANGTTVGTRIVDANGKVTDVPNPPPGSTPKAPGTPDPGTSNDRPSRIGDRDGGGDRARGDRNFRMQPRFDARPGYDAPPPRSQPRYVNDDPTCLQGTWAMQDDQKKYVCLSWYFRGRIYTPEQLEQILAQLGRPRPALLGG
jgi:hypothetical protein